MPKIAILAALLCLTLHAKMIVSPQAAMQSYFGKESAVTKKSVMLTKKETASLQQRSRTKIKSSIFKLYVASKEKRTAGYGVLLTQKVRTKSATILYLVDDKGNLGAAEIIAFNEPTEYIPPNAWLTRLVSSDASALEVGKGVPNVTGATLSARMVTDNARVAVEFVKTLLERAQ